MQIKEAQYKGFMYFKTSTLSNSLQEDKKKCIKCIIKSIPK